MPVLAILLAPRLAFGADRDKEEARTEITPVPLIGGSSDVGIGGGGLISIGRVEPGYEPYRYRLEATALITFKRSESGKLIAPFQDHYLLLRVPHLMKDRLGLSVRVSYTRESTLKYYGLGNASKIPAGRELNDTFFEYDRIHPTFLVSSQLALFDPFSVQLAVSYTHNWLDIPAGRKLSIDQASSDSLIREHVGSAENHGVLTYSYGLALDTRDHEVSPRRGQYHTARIDYSPGGVEDLPYRWGRFDSAFRIYFPVGGRSTLAFRLVSDLLFGDPPVYELARFDTTSALGGPHGVRGVPGQRYHGMVKIFGNAEIRVPLFDFHFLGKTNTLGFAAFCDSGRLWATYERRPDLDGTELGLKLGLGAGPRLQAGKTFVLRIDAAWSPDAEPIGAYLASGHIF